MRFVHCLADNMSNMLMHKNETLNTRIGEVLDSKIEEQIKMFALNQTQNY